MRFSILTVLLALAAVAACTEATTPDPEIPPTPSVVPYAPVTVADSVATEDEIARCREVGGEIQAAGRAGSERCIQSFEDAGTACADDSDCTGNCLVQGEFLDAGAEVTGACAPDDNPFGCYQAVSGGTAEQAICVD